MTITLDLPKAVEQTIEEQARQRDMTVADYLLDIALRTASDKKPLREKNQRALDMLKRWDNPTEAEIAEQKEAWEFLRKALDEDRPGQRKLFPEEASR
jgi:hypothetical protein